MTNESARKGLSQDEQLFLKSLDTANADLMLSIFAKVNGVLNEKTFTALTTDEPAESSKILEDSAVAEKSSPDDLEEVADSTIKFIAAWRAKDADTLQSMVDQLCGPALPPSHVAREKTRARRLDPEIRFRLPGILEDIKQVIDDSACRVSSARPNGQMEGVFEEDAIATEMLHSVIDYLSLYPNINQISSEYHTRRHFDLEWDYSKKIMTALDPAGKVIAVEDYSDPDEDK